MKPALTALAVLVLAAGAPDVSGARDRDKPTPSGLPVPRWTSLKFDEVNARKGPGDDYEVAWVYRVRRLPVQVIEETRDWRKVCDPDGATAWVKRTALDSRRTLFRSAKDDLPLRSGPKPDARVVARLRAHSIVDLDKAKGGWLKVKVEGASGWAEASDLWGSDEKAQCR